MEVVELNTVVADYLPYRDIIVLREVSKGIRNYLKKIKYLEHIKSYHHDTQNLHEDYYVDKRTGRKEGPYREYYSNGQLYISTHYEDNEYNGESFMYYQDGQLALKITYVNGRREGYSIKYYPNGNINVEGRFRNDRIHGKIIDYYENGNIMSILFYKRSVLDKTNIKYHPNGNVQSVHIYNDGKEITRYTYDDNGVLTSISNFDSGLLHGDTFNYENGKMVEYIKYNYGVFDEIINYD